MHSQENNSIYSEKEWGLIHPDVFREPRSIREGFHYKPHWRGRLVMDYLVQANEAKRMGEHYDLPDTERDPYVINSFQTFRHGIDPTGGLFKWATNIQKLNSVLATGSVIKAQCLAGRNVGEIAADCGTDARAVDCFLKLFFDVEDCLDKPEYLRSLIFGGGLEIEQKDKDVETKYGRFLMVVAYCQKWEGLRRNIYRREPLTDEERAKLTQNVDDNFLVTADQYSEFQKLSTQPRPVGFDRHVVLRNANSLSLSAKNGFGKDGDSYLKLVELVTGAHQAMLDRPDLDFEDRCIIEAGNREDIAPAPAIVTAKKSPEIREHYGVSGRRVKKAGRFLRN